MREFLKIGRFTKKILVYNCGYVTSQAVQRAKGTKNAGIRLSQGPEKSGQGHICMRTQIAQGFRQSVLNFISRASNQRDFDKAGRDVISIMELVSPAKAMQEVA